MPDWSPLANPDKWHEHFKGIEDHDGERWGLDTQWRRVRRILPEDHLVTWWGFDEDTHEYRIYFAIARTRSQIAAEDAARETVPPEREVAQLQGEAHELRRQIESGAPDLPYRRTMAGTIELADPVAWVVASGQFAEWQAATLNQMRNRVVVIQKRLSELEGK